MIICLFTRHCSIGTTISSRGCKSTVQVDFHPHRSIGSTNVNLVGIILKLVDPMDRNNKDIDFRGFTPTARNGRSEGSK